MATPGAHPEFEVRLNSCCRLMRKCGASILGAILISAFLTLCSQAQRLAPIPVEDTLSPKRFTMLSTIEFSPDGKSFVYAAEDPHRRRMIADETTRESGVWSYVSGSDVYVITTLNGEIRNLTGGKGGNWNPAWSPNGRYLAFLSDRDGSGTAKLWLWDVAANSLHKVSDTPIATLMDRIRWLPDNRGVLVTTSPELAAPRKTDRPPEMGTPTETKGATATIYRSSPASQARLGSVRSDPWDLDQFLQDLVLIDVSDGSVKVLDRGHRVTDRALSSDGKTIVFTGPNRFLETGSQQTTCDLAVIDVPTGKANTLLRDIRIGPRCNFISLSPDGSKLAYQQRTGESAKGDYFVLDLRAKTPPRNITAFPPSLTTRAGGLPAWDPDGRYIVVSLGDSIWKAGLEGGGAKPLAAFGDRGVEPILSRNEKSFWSSDENKSMVVLVQSDKFGGKSGFYKVDLSTGDTKTLLEGELCLTCASQRESAYVSADGRRGAYIAEDATHAADLWITDEEFANPRRLTRLNPELDKYEMGGTRLIEWQSLDGKTLHGIVQFPAGYEAGTRYPLIVCVYGGAILSQQENRFGGYPGLGLNAQLLATRGYAILYPDAPQELGTPMLDLAKTILPAVNKTVELGIADPDRLGVTGMSYGGYSTLSLLVQTKRFKAAVMVSGYGNVISDYGEFGGDGSAYAIAIAEHGQGLMGGTPWQFRDRYIENSPVFYLDRVETPLLIVHGAADTAVASFLADEVFVDLRRLGKEVVYAKYQGENHGAPRGTYANQLDYCNRVIRWFDEHLKGVNESK